MRALKSSGRICIFVVIKGQGQDDFYVFKWEELQQILREDYKDGPRPKNPETLHHESKGIKGARLDIFLKLA
jgi:hypothetical protein